LRPPRSRPREGRPGLRYLGSREDCEGMERAQTSRFQREQRRGRDIRVGRGERDAILRLGARRRSRTPGALPLEVRGRRLYARRKAQGAGQRSRELFARSGGRTRRELSPAGALRTPRRFRQLRHLRQLSARWRMERTQEPWSEDQYEGARLQPAILARRP